MMAARVPAPAIKGRDFAFCDLRLSVVVYEGTVQIAFLADGWEGGPRKLLSNCFVDASTPDQLIALAQYLRGLPLPEAAIPHGGRA